MQPGLKIYKSAKTLYTLARADKSGTSWGETINGEYIAGQDSLFIAEPGISKAVEMWGSTVSDGPGWQTTGGREGSELTADRCLKLVAGEKFKFSLRSLRSDLPHTYSLELNVYRWDDTCWCLQHEHRTVDFRVQPIDRDLVEPSWPQRVEWTKSNQSEDTELRIRCCPLEANPGNLLKGFIAWPGGNGLITEGHGKGWSIVGDVLTSPGPESKKYVFEATP